MPGRGPRFINEAGDLPSLSVMATARRPDQLNPAQPFPDRDQASHVGAPLNAEPQARHIGRSVDGLAEHRRPGLRRPSRGSASTDHAQGNGLDGRQQEVGVGIDLPRGHFSPFVSFGQDVGAILAPDRTPSLVRRCPAGARRADSERARPPRRSYRWKGRCRRRTANAVVIAAGLPPAKAYRRIQLRRRPGAEATAVKGRGFPQAPAAPQGAISSCAACRT